MQRAFIEHDALQCGFCTPGMVMSCAQLVDKNPDCTLEDVTDRHLRSPVPLRYLSQHLQSHAGRRCREQRQSEMSGAESFEQRTLSAGIVGDAFKQVTRKVPSGEPPAWPTNAELSVVGKDVPRMDALDKVTGRARYTFDVQLPGMLYARTLNSTVPHARIKSIDTSRAESIPAYAPCMCSNVC